MRRCVLTILVFLPVLRRRSGKLRTAPAMPRIVPVMHQLRVRPSRRCSRQGCRGTPPANLRKRQMHSAAARRIVLVRRRRVPLERRVGQGTTVIPGHRRGGRGSSRRAACPERRSKVRRGSVVRSPRVVRRRSCVPDRVHAFPFGESRDEADQFVY